MMSDWWIVAAVVLVGLLALFVFGWLGSLS